MRTSVLIVGAGPTGLMAANQLARFGIDFIIIDKKSGPTHESRAIAVTARSLEIYQQMGLARQALEAGKKIQSFNLYSQGHPMARVIIGEIGKGLSEFSYMLALEQSKNETLLSSNLIKQGKVIHWNHEFIELTEWTNGIGAKVKRDKNPIEIKADYLIACDGSSSAIRQQLGFSFKGGTYEQKFFVADTELDWDLSYDQLIIAPGDQNFCAFLPLYGDGHYRIIGTLPQVFDQREDVSFQDIESVVVDTLGKNVSFESVNWFSTYKLHHRRVDHFRKDRVFLAGDSAHIHSPAGGQGMNTGLQDAYNLAWKLALVLKSKAHPRLLDTYNAERLPFAKWLLKFTDRGFNMMTNTNWFIKQFRKLIVLRAAGLMLSSSQIRPFIFKTISQIGYSYYRSPLSYNSSSQKLKFKAGDRVPFLPVEKIYQQLTQASFHLIHINQHPLNPEQMQLAKSRIPFEIKLVEQKLSGGWQKLGVRRELFLLTRPDNYISFVSDSLDEDYKSRIGDFL